MTHVSPKVLEFQPYSTPHNTINLEKLFAWRASEYVRCHQTNISGDYDGITDMLRRCSPKRSLRVRPAKRNF